MTATQPPPTCRGRPADAAFLHHRKSTSARTDLEPQHGRPSRRCSPRIGGRSQPRPFSKRKCAARIVCAPWAREKAGPTRATLVRSCVSEFFPFPAVQGALTAPVHGRIASELGSPVSKLDGARDEARHGRFPQPGVGWRGALRSIYPKLRHEAAAIQPGSHSAGALQRSLPCRKRSATGVYILNRPATSRPIPTTPFVPLFDFLRALVARTRTATGDIFTC